MYDFATCVFIRPKTCIIQTIRYSYTFTINVTLKSQATVCVLKGGLFEQWENNDLQIFLAWSL